MVVIDLVEFNHGQLSKIQSRSTWSNLNKFWLGLTQPNYVGVDLSKFNKIMVVTNLFKFGQISIETDSSEFSRILARIDLVKFERIVVEVNSVKFNQFSIVIIFNQISITIPLDLFWLSTQPLYIMTFSSSWSVTTFNLDPTFFNFRLRLTCLNLWLMYYVFYQWNSLKIMNNNWTTTLMF